MSDYLDSEDQEDPTSAIDPGALIVDSFLTEDQLEAILQEWEKSHGIFHNSEGEVPGAEPSKF